MSIKHPIIAITGSSGAGTSSATKIFQEIFRRENIRAAIVEGDSFHRYDRNEMKEKLEDAELQGNYHFSHFGPDANLFSELEGLFKEFAATGAGKRRLYLHDENEAISYNQEPGTFTPWEALPPDTDLLFYEGLHGGVVTDRVNAAQYVDLLIGVTPIINLEWIQKIHRDKELRGYSTEAVTDTILRRMHDYVYYITPQFSRTHVNIQRVPTVDTSNPFISRYIPKPDESLLVIRFRNASGVDFPYLLSMIHDSFMSRANTIVVPGEKMELAMQLIFTPMVNQIMAKKKMIHGVTKCYER